MLSRDKENTMLDNAAETYSPEQEENVIRRLPKKLETLQSRSHIGSISFLITTIHSLFRMLRTKEFHLSFSSKAMIVCALAYFILPTDLTPDFIPFIGYIDDTAVIMALLRRIGSEIERFNVWLQNNPYP